MPLDNYYFLKMIDAAGGVSGRKKLQKLVYLSKLEGCPIEDRYFLHYFGPYSSDLAARVDDLVERGRLMEQATARAPDVVEYKYVLSEPGRAKLDEVDQRVPAEVRAQANDHAQRFAEWARRDSSELELAATMLYWREWGQSWDDAEATTASMKDFRPNSQPFRSARSLAEETWARRSR